MLEMKVIPHLLYLGALILANAREMNDMSNCELLMSSALVLFFKSQVQ
jgi:hypothetical protein